MAISSSLRRRLMSENLEPATKPAHINRQHATIVSDEVLCSTEGVVILLVKGSAVTLSLLPRAEVADDAALLMQLESCEMMKSSTLFPDTSVTPVTVMRKGPVFEQRISHAFCAGSVLGT